MVTENEDEDRELREWVVALLSQAFGDALVAVRPGAWKAAREDVEIWALYLADAGSAERADGDMAEPALEMVRALDDLGYAGTVRPVEAAAHLRRMAEARHVRMTRRAHPDASGRIATAAVATLYLQDLQVAELVAAVEEIRTLRT